MNTSTTFENTYDTYSSMLYGIALQISPNEKVAEEILIITFETLYEQKSYLKRHPSLCVLLIKLIIKTGRERFSLKSNFKLKQFENSLLLHKLLCEEITVENVCQQSSQTRAQVTKKIREEINLIRNLPKENGVAV